MSGTSLVPYKKKTYSGQPAIDTANEVLPPLDYSFCNIENLKDAEKEEARTPVFARKGKHPPSPREGEKSNTRSLKLNNNRLVNEEGILDFVKLKIDMWEDIAWVDLSQNEITVISPALTELVNLQILYLHGNQITSIKQVENLAPMRQLRKLTLHCNPFQDVQYHRYATLSMLPNLQNLDFCCVTKGDRKTASVIGKVDCAAVKKKKQKNQLED